MKLILLSILCCFIISCGDDFEKKSKLSGLRVLALKADTPEINSASAVTITPLISFVSGGSGSLNYSWEACPDPGIDYGADISCSSSLASLKLSGSGTFGLAALSATSNTGDATSLSVGIPADAFTYLNSLDSKTQFNGLGYLFIIKYTDSVSGASTKAFRSIKLSSKTSGELNVNPTNGSIQFNGSNISSYPSSKGDISVANLSESETYDFDSDIGIQSLKENMFVSWYSTTGEFLFNRTDIGEKNTFTPSGTAGVILIVYRDGRGGVTSSLVSF
jgi:hypothetical protein